MGQVPRFCKYAIVTNCNPSVLLVFTNPCFYFLGSTLKLTYRTREHAKYESVLHYSKRTALWYHGFKTVIEQNS